MLGERRRASPLRITTGTLAEGADPFECLQLRCESRRFYVSNADRERAVWMAFDVLADGTLGPGRVLFDATGWARVKKGVPDGLKVDRDGNLLAAGPGGIHVLSPDGKHLGSFEIDVPAANAAWGEDWGAEGAVLYLTADTSVYRVRLKTKGHPGFPLQRASKTPS